MSADGDINVEHSVHRIAQLIVARRSSPSSEDPIAVDLFFLAIASLVTIARFWYQGGQTSNKI